MVIAMTVAGVVLAIVASISIREQRLFSDIAERNALRAQLRDAGAVLPMDLRALWPAGADIREARDTSLELRATLGIGVVCDTSGGRLTLAPSLGGAATLAAFQAPPDSGDTAWVLSPTSDDVWRARRVIGQSSVPGATCAVGGPTLADSARAKGRTALKIDSMPSVPVGAAIRVTRVVRYSIYRASDGSWYLGQKQYNAGLARFDAIQPIAGPFLSAAQRGLMFVYLDSTGIALPMPVTSTSSIAMIRLELRGETSRKLRDSTIVTVAIRNRR
jgi:hypothetical protein